MPGYIKIKTSPDRVKLYKQTANNIKTHSKQLEEIKVWKEQLLALKSKYPESAIMISYEDRATLLDYAALLNIAMLDLVIISRTLAISDIDYERIFYSKHAYSVIYETISQYNKQNKLIYEMIEAKAPDLLSNMAAITKELKDFKKSFGYESTIKTIRNKVGAHINSFDEYYDVMASIDSTIVINAIIEFVSIVVKLFNVAEEIVKLNQAEMERDYQSILESLRQAHGVE